jgi:hypothetical protein
MNTMSFDNASAKLLAQVHCLAFPFLLPALKTFAVCFPACRQAGVYGSFSADHTRRRPSLAVIPRRQVFNSCAESFLMRLQQKRKSFKRIYQETVLSL